MSFRESNSEKAEQALPNFIKTDEQENKDEGKSLVDGAASHFPGQSKPRDALDSKARDPDLTHDAGRQGPGAMLDALKPSGEQTYTEATKQKLDQVGSEIQPEGDKSMAQQARDYITPGNAASGGGQKQGQGQGQGQGITDQVTGMAVGAKDAVVNMFSGEGTKPEER